MPVKSNYELAPVSRSNLLRVYGFRKNAMLKGGKRSDEMYRCETNSIPPFPGDMARGGPNSICLSITASQLRYGSPNDPMSPSPTISYSAQLKEKMEKVQIGK